MAMFYPLVDAAGQSSARANGTLGWLDAQLPSDEEDDSDFE